MKRIIPILILSVLLGASCSKDKNAPTDEKPADTLALLITGIQKCSKLYATECHVHKIITHKDKVKSNFTILNQEISLDVPVGVRKIAIPIDAVLKAYVNFDGFSEKNVQRNGEKIMITLPDPEIVLTSTKVNHAEMKQYVPLLRGNFSDEEMAGYINEGRQAIVKAIPELGLIENARKSAASQLVPMIMALGYTDRNITIAFRKNFTESDLRTIIDKSTVENNE